MTMPFGETLRCLRTEKGLSQQQLADSLHVSRPTVVNWEAGRRMPDATTIAHLADALNANPAILFSAAEEPEDITNILLIDDEPIVLSGGISILKTTFPNANVVGFEVPVEALEYVKKNPVALVFLDIELGRNSGISLCRELLQIRPRTNVIYLTAFPEYALESWDTGASGFMLKPLETEAIKKQLSLLRYPVRGLS